MAVRDSATGLHYLHQDHLGSTSLQTSPSGAIKGSQFRGPFGQPWVASGSLATDFQYTGQRSFESGVSGAAGGLGSLAFYGSRWYSPVLGRFLQPDTIVPGAGNPQHLNRYSYVGNNPVRRVDPTGHISVDEEGDPVAEWAAEQAAAVSGAIAAATDVRLADLAAQDGAGDADVIPIRCRPCDTVVTTSQVAAAGLVALGGYVTAEVARRGGIQWDTGGQTASPKPPPAPTPAGGTSQSTGTVWDYIRPTQPSYTGLDIPRSFEIEVDAGTRYWVHGNATKHMADHLLRDLASDSANPMNQQAMLTSFRGALVEASNEGIRWSEIMRVGQWELKLVEPSRPTDMLPIVIHAVFYG